MNLRCRTDSRKRMLDIHPLNSSLSLRPLNLHCHFQSCAPHLAPVVMRMRFSRFEIDTGKFPQRFAITLFPITKPPDESSWFCPTPSALSALLKQFGLLFAHLCPNPVATLPFNEVNRPTLGGCGGEGSRRRECRLHPLRVSHLSRLVQAVTTVQFAEQGVAPNA